MSSPIIGGILAFLVGFGVSGINYALNLSVLRKKPEAVASLSVVRQALNIGCLAAAFFLSRVLPWGSTPLLVGAALGLTIPSVLLSMRLAKVNDALSESAPHTAEEGDDPNG